MTGTPATLSCRKITALTNTNAHTTAGSRRDGTSSRSGNIAAPFGWRTSASGSAAAPCGVVLQTAQLRVRRGGVRESQRDERHVILPGLLVLRAGPAQQFGEQRRRRQSIGLAQPF